MDIQKLIEEVKAMSVLELNELVKALEAEFGVSIDGNVPLQEYFEAIGTEVSK